MTRLFYPSTEKAMAAKSQESDDFDCRMKYHLGKLEMLGDLSQPMFTFKPTPMPSYSGGFLEFASLLGDDENKIIINDHMGHTLVFDALDSSSIAFPTSLVPCFMMPSPYPSKRLVETTTRTMTPSMSLLRVPAYNVWNIASKCSITPLLLLLLLRLLLLVAILHMEDPPIGVLYRRHPSPTSGKPTLTPTQWLMAPLSTFLEMTNATYAFDTVQREWNRVGNWTMSLHGKSKYVQNLNFGLDYLPITPTPWAISLSSLAYTWFALMVNMRIKVVSDDQTQVHVLHLFR
uniref:Uncharacterized protein n=1 Tax=Leersia perrieri TaxID=77586 RepID=A0A0D9XNC3_9ORYZ